MKTIRFIAISGLLIFSLMLLPENNAKAGIANGEYFNSYSGTTKPIWFLTGTYTTGDLGFGLAMDNLSINHDTHGHLTGNGLGSTDNPSWNIPGLSFAGPYMLTGKVMGSGSVTRVTMEITITGTGTADTYPVTVRDKINISGEIDPATGELILTNGSHALLKEKKVGTGVLNGGVARAILTPGDPILQLSPEATGDWSIDLLLTPVGNRYNGRATILTTPYDYLASVTTITVTTTTSVGLLVTTVTTVETISSAGRTITSGTAITTGTTFVSGTTTVSSTTSHTETTMVTGTGSANYFVVGSYNPTLDISKLSLKGSGGSLSMQIRTSGTTMTIQSVTGSVFGQKLSF